MFRFSLRDRSPSLRHRKPWRHIRVACALPPVAGSVLVIPNGRWRLRRLMGAAGRGIRRPRPVIDKASARGSAAATGRRDRSLRRDRVGVAPALSAASPCPATAAELADYAWAARRRIIKIM